MKSFIFGAPGISILLGLTTLAAAMRLLPAHPSAALALAFIAGLDALAVNCAIDEWQWRPRTGEDGDPVASAFEGWVTYYAADSDPSVLTIRKNKFHDSDLQVLVVTNRLAVPMKVAPAATQETTHD